MTYPYYTTTLCIMVVQELIRIQQREKLTDAQMAEKLGYSHRENWLRVKRTKAFGPKLLMNARRAFPETARVIDIFLSGNATP